MMDIVGSNTLTASNLPPRPTSSIAISTLCFLKISAAAKVVNSKYVSSVSSLALSMNCKDSTISSSSTSC